jgi:hypothetical protein
VSKRVPATGPPPRVIHYVQPGPRANNLVDPADVAARRRDQQTRYDHWLTRQEAIQRRDRAVRLVLLVIAIVIGVGLLAVVAVLGWTVYQAVTHPSHGTWLDLFADTLHIHARLADVRGVAAGSVSPVGVGR